MKKTEWVGRVLIVLGVLIAVAIPILFRMRTPLLHARIAENGGWSPSLLQARVGEPLHLRLTSDDVLHGFAVGQMDTPAVDIEPGKVSDVTLNFTEPGTYTFYCTRWCGLNHWRMRGTILVSGSTPVNPTPVSQPLYETLGLDIDAPHPATILPKQKPSANLALQELILEKYLVKNYYRSHSPEQVWQDLNSDPELNSSSDQELWNRVAAVWKANTSPAGLADGKALYAQNCAACHGENGGGDGVYARFLAPGNDAGTQPSPASSPGNLQKPSDFTDSRTMLGASPAVLQGKILRGGMGTGMPMWGSIFTDEQIWDLVAYLYAFQFEY